MLNVNDSVSTQKNGITKQRLLLVDDEVAILLGFKKLIQSDYLDVDTAETIEEAMTLLNAKNYQFVITDLKLGGSTGEDGFEVIKYAKEKEKKTAVILITGYGTPEIMDKAFSMGAAYYYEKPVSATVLRDALKTLGL